MQQATAQRGRILHPSWPISNSTFAKNLRETLVAVSSVTSHRCQTKTPDPFSSQAPPIAQIPLGNPFALDPPFTGRESLRQVNQYRRGVNQRQVHNPEDASTTKYCRKMRAVQPKKLFRDKSSFTAFRSPDSTVADTLFTFMAQRYVGSYEILKCESLLNKPVNVALKTAEDGIVIDATLLQTKHDVTEHIPLDGDDSGNQME